MSGRNFNDVMQYWGGKDKALPKSVPRNFKVSPRFKNPPQVKTSPEHPPLLAVEPNPSTAQHVEPNAAVVIVIPVQINNNNTESSSSISPDSANVEHKIEQVEDLVGEEDEIRSDQNSSSNCGYNNFSSDEQVPNRYSNQESAGGSEGAVKGSQKIATSYNSSNYGGSYSVSNYGSSAYGSGGLYGADLDRANSYLLDEDDDVYYDDEDGEFSDLKDKSYNERDISETDLQELEYLLKNNSFSISEDSEMEIQARIEEMKKNESKLVSTTDTVSSNPYISAPPTNSMPSFIISNSYKDTQFLTESRDSALSGPKKMVDEALTSWNSEFQKLIEMDDCLEKFERLSQLEHDFVYASETYGRIIISEHFLPVEHRTIKPVTVGGIAGGEKYIVQGILFKFAVENETFGLYGNDENAMKTAAHELNGCTSFLNVGVKGIHVPLMAYIDYRGFRLVAMSLLPISKKSLVYGSSDAGQSVHTSNTLFNHLFATSAKIVNLKAHVVQDSTGDFKTIHGPIDIEGHIGTDNRFYLLDFARLSPPEPPSHRGSYLYKLLRLEFVRTYQKPLCSDAFSPMVSIDIEAHNTDVREAYQYLLDEVIPKFAKTMDKKTSKEIYKEFNFTKQLHSEGINVRLIGQIYQHVQNISSLTFLLCEAIIRTLKSLAREILRREMKKTHMPSDFPYRNKILNFLNLIFGEYKGETQHFWEKILLKKLSKKFKGIEERPIAKDGSLIHFTVVKDNLIDPSSPLNIIKTMIMRSGFLINHIFKGFIDSIGLKMAPDSIEDFTSNCRLNVEGGFLFVDPDIKELSTKITRLNIIDYADGMSLYFKSLLLKQNKSKSRLLSISKSRLEHSLSSMSTNYGAMYQLGNVIRLMSKSQTSSELCESLELAETTYLALEKLRIDPNLLFQSKISRCKTLYQKILNYNKIDESLEKIREIHKSILVDFPAFKGLYLPKYLLAKALVVISSRSYRDEGEKEAMEVLTELLEDQTNDFKIHMLKAKFLISSGLVRNEIITREERDELVKKHLMFALEGDFTLVRKLKKLLDQKPWAVISMSYHIKQMIPVLKEIVNRSKDLVIPSEIMITDELASHVFRDFSYESLKMTCTEHPDSIVNLLAVLNTEHLKKINFHSISVLNDQLPISIVNLSNNLVNINVGRCRFINDDNLLPMITPKLRKLKIYDNDEITDDVLVKISDTCSELLSLDIGQVEKFTALATLKVIDTCPNLKSLALPPSVEDITLTSALGLKDLKKLDLFKCSKLPREMIVKAFDTAPALTKLRDVAGVPHAKFPQFFKMEFITSVLGTHGNESISFATHETEKILQMVSQVKMIPFQKKVVHFYANNTHKFFRFRDPQFEERKGYTKLFHVDRVDKPFPSLNFYTPGVVNAQHNVRIQDSHTVAPAFVYDYHTYYVFFSGFHQSPGQYNFELKDPVTGAAHIRASNARIKTNHQIDFVANLSLITALRAFAISCSHLSL